MALNSGFVVPCGDSVNSGIGQKFCSLSYVLVDDAVNHMLELGQVTNMVKLDLKGAYRIVRIQSHDQHLLARLWRGESYIYTKCVLLFGFRSALKIFTDVVDALV